MKYYFEQIKDARIQEGYTIINIVNHEAEIASDDPDAVLVARKNDGRPKEQERFHPPPPPIWGFFRLTDAADLGNLSKSDIGEGYFAIEIPLDIDTLADVIFDHLPRISRGYLYVEHVNWPRSFRLHCARWGFLGELQFSRRGSTATIFKLDYVPTPTGDELAPAKMLGEFERFRYGKRKHRGDVIRRLFDSLRYDPIWQGLVSAEAAKLGLVENKHHLYNLLKQHKSNLNKLRERQAKHGIDAPLSLLNEIEDEESAIIRIEAELQSLAGLV